MINFLLSYKVLEDCLKVALTALGKSTKNISIHFIRQGAKFIQNHSGMQLLGDDRDVLCLNLG